MIEDFEFYNGDLVLRGNDISLVQGSDAVVNAILNLAANPQGSFVPDPNYGSSMMYILAKIDINLGNRADIENVLRDSINLAITRYNSGLFLLSDTEVHINEIGDIDIIVKVNGVDNSEDKFVCKINRTGKAYKVERIW
jgi:phage baseplate assembly protein W